MAFGETIDAGEAEQFRKFAEEIGAIQRVRAGPSGTAARVLHLKQHVGAVGELVVTANERVRFGVFAELGKRWPIYARFSNGSGRHQSDGTPDARGFALKLVGVPGRKLIEGMEDEATQDFLFIDTQSIPFRDPGEFMAFLRAAKDGPLRLLPRLIASLGFGRALRILRRALGAEKVTSFATHSFHTGAPVALGGGAAKLGLFPEPSGVERPPVGGNDYLREDLVRRLREGSLSWSLRAQLFVDETTTPIEDASVEWSGAWLELATLTLPKQDPETPRGKELAELVNAFSFDPWHAGEDHRPLGSMMRARRVAYAPSSTGRKAAPEPRSVLEL